MQRKYLFIFSLVIITNLKSQTIDYSSGNILYEYEKKYKTSDLLPNIPLNNQDNFIVSKSYRLGCFSDSIYLAKVSTEKSIKDSLWTGRYSLIMPYSNFLYRHYSYKNKSSFLKDTLSVNAILSPTGKKETILNFVCDEISINDNGRIHLAYVSQSLPSIINPFKYRGIKGGILKFVSFYGETYTAKRIEFLSHKRLMNRIQLELNNSPLIISEKNNFALNIKPITSIEEGVSLFEKEINNSKILIFFDATHIFNETSDLKKMLTPIGFESNKSTIETNNFIRVENLCEYVSSIKDTLSDIIIFTNENTGLLRYFIPEIFFCKRKTNIINYTDGIAQKINFTIFPAIICTDKNGNIIYTKNFFLDNTDFIKTLNEL